MLCRYEYDFRVSQTAIQVRVRVEITKSATQVQGLSNVSALWWFISQDVSIYDVCTAIFSDVKYLSGASKRAVCVFHAPVCDKGFGKYMWFHALFEERFWDSGICFYHTFDLFSGRIRWNTGHGILCALFTS